MNKVWFNGKILDSSKAKVSLFTHTLHYGTGVFEGIRCYQTEKGPAVFRLKDHLKRLFNSAKVLKLKINYSLNDLIKAVNNVVKANKLQNCYIRPIVFYGEKLILPPDNVETNVAILAFPMGKHLKENASVCMSKIIRLHPKSVYSEAKVCGYYVNSIFAYFEAKKKGYNEAILLDYRGFVAEGPGENIFLVKNNTLSTPKLGSILPGITRNSVIKIARDLGYKVIEKDISYKELVLADELFFTGTAVEITPITKIEKYKKNIGPITQKIKETYQNIVHGKIKKYINWLHFVN